MYRGGGEGAFWNKEPGEEGVGGASRVPIWTEKELKPLWKTGVTLLGKNASIVLCCFPLFYSYSRYKKVVMRKKY